jgi:hypothetical protein
VLNYPGCGELSSERLKISTRLAAFNSRPNDGDSSGNRGIRACRAETQPEVFIAVELEIRRSATLVRRRSGVECR